MDANKSEKQQEMLAEIAKVRGYPDTERFNLADAVQVYNQDVVQQLIGDMDLYQSCFHMSTGDSLVYGKLFVPGFAPTGELLTFICYDTIGQQESKMNHVHAPAYFYPQTGVLHQKGAFVYAPLRSWEPILHSKDVYIVDGLWDCVTLNMLGLPCLSLLGSNLTTPIKRILHCFSNIYFVMDNDGAGSSLYKLLLQEFHSVFRVVVPISVGKDVDEYVMKVGRNYFLEQIKSRTSVYLKGV